MFKNTKQYYNTPLLMGLMASRLLVCSIAHAISPDETKWARMPDAQSSFDDSNLAMGKDGNIYPGGSKDGYTGLVRTENEVTQPRTGEWTLIC